MSVETAFDGYTRTARETEVKLALYGSIGDWPTMLLSHNDFALCGCGHSRIGHPFETSIQRGRCKAKGCPCEVFVAPNIGKRW